MERIPRSLRIALGFLSRCVRFGSRVRAANMADTEGAGRLLESISKKKGKQRKKARFERKKRTKKKRRKETKLGGDERGDFWRMICWSKISESVALNERVC